MQIASGPVFKRVLLDDPYFGCNELAIPIWHSMPDADYTGSVDLDAVEKKYQLPFFSIALILWVFSHQNGVFSSGLQSKLLLIR